jgi:ABC-type transport system involved in multi-copper enzyme maturation permease subunit
MNPLIKKEIRLLLPAWVAAMLLAIVPVWIASVWSNFPPQETLYVPFAFDLGILLLSITSFGQEFSLGTFSIFLSQPTERRRVWLVKTTVLAVAFILVFLAMVVSWKIYSWERPTHTSSDLLLQLGSQVLYAVAFLSSGLWTTLLLRRMSEAFWLSLLTPLALVFIIDILLSLFISSAQTASAIFTATIFSIALAVYAGVGFFQARSLFLRAQDQQWTGGNISFLWRKKSLERTPISSRSRYWFFTLLRKEFQLHQVNLLIAVIILFLHLASVFILKIHPHFQNPEVKSIMETIWVLWLLMPLLIGSAAAAEEHRLGVIESQLCLPVTRRAQLFIKFCVALVLSLALGGVMPFIIEKSSDLSYWVVVTSAGIFFISFYASSVARTTIQAIGLTIVLAIAIFLYLIATTISIARFGHSYSSEQLGLALLKLHVGLPIMVLVLFCLEFWNFKWLHENRKLWRCNLITVLAAFASIFLLCHAIYFRVWEFFMPLKEPHGTSRLSISKPPKLLADWQTIFALLPDGKFWTEQITSFETGRIIPRLNTQRYIGGSNWTDVASCFDCTLGIKSDGSLWSFQTYPTHRAYPLTRIGSGTNWFQVAGRYPFLLLKKNRTLWYWGTDDNSRSSEKLKRYLIMSPKQIGSETNWTKVFQPGFARKSDGSIWQLVSDNDKTNTAPHLQPLNPAQWPNRGFVSYSSGYIPSLGDSWLGIKTNEELWLTIVQNNHKPKNFQLGKNAQWKAAAFATVNSIIALRSDGTLWIWKLASFWNRSRNPSLIKPVQLGTYSHWITLFPYSAWSDRSFALAADGSLWVWQDPSEHKWLAPSRQPVQFGNIFNQAK